MYQCPAVYGRRAILYEPRAIRDPICFFNLNPKNPNQECKLNKTQIHKIALRCLGGALLVSLMIPVASGQWQLVDNFMGDEEEFWENWAMQASVPAMYTLAIAETVPDPLDPDNRVLFFNSNAFETNIWDQTSIFNTTTQPIEDGMEATLYFQFFKTGNNAAGVMGFVDNQIVYPPTFDFVDDRRIIQESIGWGAYSVYMRPQFPAGSGSGWEVYDTARFTLVPDFQVLPGYWYEIWVHVMNNPGVGLDEYATYIRRSDDDGEPTLLRVPAGDDIYDTALFKRQIDDEAGPLRMWGISMTMDSPANRNAGDPWYWDDIYIDYSGLNLTRPDGATLPAGELELWNALPLTRVNGAAWVDTGARMNGQIAVDHDPFVWSHTAQAWLHLDSFHAVQPVWVYFYDREDGSPSLPEAVYAERVLVETDNGNGEDNGEEEEPQYEDGDIVYGYSEDLRRWVYIPVDNETDGGGWALLY